MTDGADVDCKTNDAGYVPGVVGGDEKLSVRVPPFTPLVGETLSQLTVGVETVHLTAPLPDLLTVAVCDGIELPDIAVTLTGFGVTTSVAWAEAETGKMSAHNNSANDRTVTAGICIVAPSRTTSVFIAARDAELLIIGKTGAA